MLKPEPQTITVDEFRRSFYEHFPRPPLSPREHRDVVKFWCVNIPAMISRPEICAR